eukprot:g5945.t1 g5945   contig20:479557-479907(-)
MRFRILNQVPKSYRSGRSTSAAGRRPPLTSSHPSPSASHSNSIHETLHTLQQQAKQSTMQTSVQQRLFSADAIRTIRAALCVEGCTVALSAIEGCEYEPNLPRGWDAGVDVDDDGG